MSVVWWCLLTALLSAIVVFLYRIWWVLRELRLLWREQLELYHVLDAIRQRYTPGADREPDA